MNSRKSQVRHGGRVLLELNLGDERMATLEIGDGYPMDFAAMRALKSVPGVGQVKPVDDRWGD